MMKIFFYILFFFLYFGCVSTKKPILYKYNLQLIVGNNIENYIALNMDCIVNKDYLCIFEKETKFINNYKQFGNDETRFINRDTFYKIIKVTMVDLNKQLNFTIDSFYNNFKLLKKDSVFKYIFEFSNLSSNSFQLFDSINSKLKSKQNLFFRDTILNNLNLEYTKIRSTDFSTENSDSININLYYSKDKEFNSFINAFNYKKSLEKKYNYISYGIYYINQPSNYFYEFKNSTKATVVESQIFFDIIKKLNKE